MELPQKGVFRTQLNMYDKTFTQPTFTCSKFSIETLETCSDLTIKTERRQWCCSGVFIVNFEHVSHLVLVFLLLTLNI